MKNSHEFNGFLPESTSNAPIQVTFQLAPSMAIHAALIFFEFHSVDCQRFVNYLLSSTMRLLSFVLFCNIFLLPLIGGDDSRSGDDNDRSLSRHGRKLLFPQFTTLQVKQF